ncbi:hypothetical protein [Burkholderia plantarii]|uniref:hypothetical protein n=1 Tax=Burkholderia plantarii TaxID=41899 RepID=UPI0018DBFBBE|nr:hypothetical protein [Burkholderia plantarii]MBI0328116.1 hypothetical protein [Burkholderia plantarii]
MNIAPFSGMVRSASGQPRLKAITDEAEGLPAQAYSSRSPSIFVNKTGAGLVHAGFDDAVLV